jgi:predicted aconitate hydratase
MTGERRRESGSGEAKAAGRARNVAEKLIESHLASGETLPSAGEEIALRIDHTLTQDATGTLVMLELDAMGLDRTEAELSCQYVDHNLVQEDHKNPEDHLFLQSACQRFGLVYSRAGNGVSHPLHMERFGVPGRTLLGSDSHTSAGGALGMLAIGAGGLEVAMAIAGFPFHVRMPEVWGIRLENELPPWVSAKDVILEMLRRFTVRGGLGRIVEYHGPGLRSLSAMDRHVIANMGAELGATATVFPADDEVRHFLARQRREQDFRELTADEGASYDHEDSIDLSRIEPLIAMPSSPGNVRPVREVQGRPVYQVYLGSSANPGYRDFAVAARIVEDKRIHDRVSLDVSPTSRQILENLIRDGHLTRLIRAGARLHQAGCNGCIGMGQAPATGKLSLRTVPRNFPGRSGTRDDQVCLVSPETAAASALRGEITDPRTLDMEYPQLRDPDHPLLDADMFLLPPPEGGPRPDLVQGSNISSLPDFDALPNAMEVPILLKVKDDISTDEILPAGARVLPFRSNIPEISRFCFEPVDETYARRAAEVEPDGGHAIVGGANYGQGSSREHAALAPRYLGLRVVLARSFARIHWQNLVNFGIVPLIPVSNNDLDRVAVGDRLKMDGLHAQLESGTIRIEDVTQGFAFDARHDLSPRQLEVLLAGGLVNWVKRAKETEARSRKEQAGAVEAR